MRREAIVAFALLLSASAEGETLRDKLEAASVPVAIISSAIARLRVAVRPVLGATNPGLPVSSVMVVICRIIPRHNQNRSRRRFGRTWAPALKNKGDSVKYG